MEQKYVVNPDNAISNAGYNFKSRMDEYKEPVLKKLEMYSDKDVITTFIQAICGVHRLKNGKILSGLLYMFTAGGFFIWMFIDFFVIMMGRFTDENGKYISFERKGLEMELESIERKFDSAKYGYLQRKEAEVEFEKCIYEMICEEIENE